MDTQSKVPANRTKSENTSPDPAHFNKTVNQKQVEEKGQTFSHKQRKVRNKMA